jgi:hypothetical protein
MAFVFCFLYKEFIERKYNLDSYSRIKKGEYPLTTRLDAESGLEAINGAFGIITCCLGILAMN